MLDDVQTRIEVLSERLAAPKPKPRRRLPARTGTRGRGRWGMGGEMKLTDAEITRQAQDTSRYAGTVLALPDRYRCRVCGAEHVVAGWEAWDWEAVTVFLREHRRCGLGTKIRLVVHGTPAEPVAEHVPVEER